MSASPRIPLVNQINDCPSFDRHASTGQTKLTVNLAAQTRRRYTLQLTCRFTVKITRLQIAEFQQSPLRSNTYEDSPRCLRLSIDFISH